MQAKGWIQSPEPRGTAGINLTHWAAWSTSLLTHFPYCVTHGLTSLAKATPWSWDRIPKWPEVPHLLGKQCSKCEWEGEEQVWWWKTVSLILNTYPFSSSCWLCSLGYEEEWEKFKKEGQPKGRFIFQAVLDNTVRPIWTTKIHVTLSNDQSLTSTE